MAVETYQLTIKAPLETVWEFIQEPAKWLPFCPGFLSVTPINQQAYLIQLYLALGFIEKETALKFILAEPLSKTEQTFSLASNHQSVTGKGAFLLIAETPQETTVKVRIELKVKGTKGLLVQPLLKSVNQKWTEELGRKIQAQLEAEQKGIQ